MTARYNIYFNGYESFKSGVIKVVNSYNDDYAEILKVFEHSDPSTPSISSADMDKAIQKASKLISLKSITAQPEIKDKDKEADIERDLLKRREYNEWVDDSYLLIGMARFYKHEFSEASSVFEYCIKEANDPDIKKEASIWLSRVYNETGKYNESFRTLTELDLSGKNTRSIRSMYYTTFADLYVRQKKYSEAIDPLSKAVSLVSGKRNKYRMRYLLAQLNASEGNSKIASSLYRKIARMNPPYDVEFNARINIAGVFDVNSGDPGEIKKELEKMLRNPKNKEYLDQIYFTLGSLEMKEGNEEEAIELFRKSASSPSGNQNQKGRSYLALADYYFNKNDLLKAGMYYDSTVFFYDNNHPDFNQLKLKSQNLNAIASHLKIIQVEDSLQMVAAMPEQQRSALIASIIAEITKAETEGRGSEYSDRYNLGQYYENERRFQGNIEQEGKWYFYNQAALTFGRTEFQRRWGDRKLEDHWRRSNKALYVASDEPESTDESVSVRQDTVKAVTDYKRPEFYLKNLPLNDSLLAASNEKIAYAYLNAGKAYSEKLSDKKQATDILEKLLNRYPDHSLVPEALFTLYNINKEINVPAAETYRQRLLERHRSTEYAIILSDPDYYAKKMAEMKMAGQLYQQAYDAWSAENFALALSICNDALEKYSEDLLAPKFMLLRAYSYAGISGEREFREELSKLRSRWPESAESKKAGELIAYLDQKMPELKVEEEKVIAKELYLADTTQAHIFALIIADPGFNINQATFDVISYNIDNYTNKNYRTEGSLVDNKYFIITVAGFADYSLAYDYYRKFATEKRVRNPSGSSIFSFLISSENLKVLNTDKNPDRYRLFFMENYMIK